MQLTDLETWLIRYLDKKTPKCDRELPFNSDVTREEMETAVDGLLKRRYVLVDGPPNQNSVFGKDVALIVLTPLGIEKARQL